MSLYYLQLCWNHIARIYNFTLYSYPWEQFSEQSGLCGLDRIWIFWTVDISYLVDSPNKFLWTVDFSIPPSIHRTSQYGLHSEQLRQSLPIPHRIMEFVSERAEAEFRRNIVIEENKYQSISCTSIGEREDYTNVSNSFLMIYFYFLQCDMNSCRTWLRFHYIVDLM